METYCEERGTSEMHVRLLVALLHAITLMTIERRLPRSHALPCGIGSVSIPGALQRYASSIWMGLSGVGNEGFDCEIACDGSLNAPTIVARR